MIKPVPVDFFKTESVNEPVREWLKELAKEDRIAIGEDIKLVQWRWPCGKPLVDYVGNQIWEVRSNLPRRRIARVFFAFVDQRIVLLHGIMKKTQKTNPHDLELARKRKVQL